MQGRESVQEGPNDSGVRHHDRAAAGGVLDDRVHGLLNAREEAGKILTSGSGNGRIVVQPVLRVCGVARHDLVPIQSLPAPEGELTE